MKHILTMIFNLNQAYSSTCYLLKFHEDQAITREVLEIISKRLTWKNRYNFRLCKIDDVFFNSVLDIEYDYLLLFTLKV